MSDYSIVNRSILPKGFGRSVDEDNWHLRTHVQLWDVNCQRQVQLRGPDAARLVQLMTPRDLCRAMRYDYWRTGYGEIQDMLTDFSVDQAGKYRCKARYATGDFDYVIGELPLFYHMAGDAVVDNF